MSAFRISTKELESNALRYFLFRAGGKKHISQMNGCSFFCAPGSSGCLDGPAFQPASMTASPTGWQCRQTHEQSMGSPVPPAQAVISNSLVFSRINAAVPFAAQVPGRTRLYDAHPLSWAGRTVASFPSTARVNDPWRSLEAQQVWQAGGKGWNECQQHQDNCVGKQKRLEFAHQIRQGYLCHVRGNE